MKAIRKRRRDALVISKQYNPNYSLPDNYRPPYVKPDARIDRRQYHPERNRSIPPIIARSVKAFNTLKRIRSYPNLVINRIKEPLTPSHWKNEALRKFEVPRVGMVCVRRYIRKQIMFAKGKAGKGVKKKDPRYNEDSIIKCRR